MGEATRCRRCGSSERRPNGKGCAECNRRGAREQTRRKTAERRAAAEFEVTPAMRAYLAAFDAWLREPSPWNERERLAALERLEDGPR